MLPGGASLDKGTQSGHHCPLGLCCQIPVGSAAAAGSPAPSGSTAMAAGAHDTMMGSRALQEMPPWRSGVFKGT